MARGINVLVHDTDDPSSIPQDLYVRRHIKKLRKIAVLLAKRFVD